MKITQNALYRADLHVHSSFSNKASIWAMKKINCPESYTTPEFIYSEARKKGMNYVTITDHNTIEGCLRIAHLPDTFISSEVTAYFPENGCKAHVVVLAISEHDFKFIMELRKNIYELVAYMQAHGIRHFIAHPLYDMGGKLTIDIVERMLLLFEAIEVKNGAHAQNFNRAINDVVMSLTREKMEEMANKHDLAAFGAEPWRKILLAGSDDHSGFFIARAHTASSEGATPKAFLDSLWKHQALPQGEDGDVLMLAHSIYGIAYRFYQEHISPKRRQSPFIDMLLNKYFNTEPQKIPLIKKIRLLVRKNMPEIYDRHEATSFEDILDKELKRLLNNRQFLDKLNAEERNRRIFAITSYLANRLVFIYTKKLFNKSLGRGLFEIFRSISTIGLVHFFIAPYYISYFAQTRDKKLLAEVEKKLCSQLSGRREKIALFTDTLEEINGVARTIKRIAGTAKKRRIDLSVITCSEQEPLFKTSVKHFESVGNFVLPEYPELQLHFPPILDILDYIQREGFTRIHSSTPGTMGLMALLTARLLNLPITGTYHTDIPQYVGHLTDDDFLEDSAWNFIIWFYNQMEEVTVPSKGTQKQLIAHGLIPQKIRPLPRWVDMDVFTPSKRDPYLWQRYGLDGEVKVLYVGRVSKEKNLELLADAFVDVINSSVNAQMVIVGDGPYKEDLEKKLAGYPVLFTGYQEGEELSAFYASSDLFIFPSATDTFGNVVLEAQASGLPVIVSDEGGPQELMQDCETGYVVKANDRKELAAVLKGMIENKDKRKVMGRNARQFIEKNAICDNEAYSTIFNL